jgi:predicted amidohydrolase YtcJ
MWNHELWGGKTSRKFSEFSRCFRGKFNEISGELPTRHWIDPVTPKNPAFLCRLDGHMCLANSLALQLANLTRHSPDVSDYRVMMS